MREEQHESAIDDFRKARAILRAVGHVSSFQGIEDEATLIMKRLSNALSVRLQQPTLPSGAIGSTTRLLLQLEGSEEQLLKEYLSRRRRSLQETLSTFTILELLQTRTSNNPSSWGGTVVPTTMGANRSQKRSSNNHGHGTLTKT